MTTPLDKFNIILADEDQQLGTVLGDTLKKMGFSNITHTQSGVKALKIFKSQPIDFMITEWQLQDMSGIELVKHIRRINDPQIATLPILFTTGKAEKQDVLTARNMGVNEYLIKPFTAKIIYNRLERIIEFPRAFVVSDKFIGPCRRRRQSPLGKMKDRRAKAESKPRPKTVYGDLLADGSQVWYPDFTLNEKLGGKDVRLGDLISEDIVANAQRTIDAISDDFLLWVKEDLDKLGSIIAMLSNSGFTPALLESLQKLALQINARAGTFLRVRVQSLVYAISILRQPICRRLCSTYSHSAEILRGLMYRVCA